MDIVNLKETQITLHKSIPRLTQTMGVEFGALVERAARLMYEAAMEWDAIEGNHKYVVDSLNSQIKTLRQELKLINKAYNDLLLSPASRPARAEPASMEVQLNPTLSPTLSPTGRMTTDQRIAREAELQRRIDEYARNETRVSRWSADEITAHMPVRDEQPARLRPRPRVNPPRLSTTATATRVRVSRPRRQRG